MTGPWHCDRHTCDACRRGHHHDCQRTVRCETTGRDTGCGCCGGDRR